MKRTISNYRTLGTLSVGTQIEFVVDGRTHRHVVREKYLHNESDCYDAVFTVLGIVDKRAFCDAAYGYSSGSMGVFPEYNVGDMEAATRIMFALFEAIDGVLVPSISVTRENVHVGMRVMRGFNWRYATQDCDADGNPTNGTVTKIRGSEVDVAWDCGYVDIYHLTDLLITVEKPETKKAEMPFVKDELTRCEHCFVPISGRLGSLFLPSKQVVCRTCFTGVYVKCGLCLQGVGISRLHEINHDTGLYICVACKQTKADTRYHEHSFSPPRLMRFADNYCNAHKIPPLYAGIEVEVELVKADLDNVMHDCAQRNGSLSAMAH